MGLVMPLSGVALEVASFVGSDEVGEWWVGFAPFLAHGSVEFESGFEIGAVVFGDLEAFGGFVVFGSLSAI